MISLTDLANEVGIYFIEEPPIATYRAMVNACLHDINEKSGKQRELLTITGVDGVWGDITTNWGDLATSWDELGLFIEGFTYYVDDYRLEIPETIDKLENLYINDIVWVSDTYEKVKSSYPSDNTFARAGNCLYFCKDIGDNENVIKAMISNNYADIPAHSDEIPLRSDFRTYLISAVISKLSGTQKYRDSDLYAIHTTKAEKCLATMLRTINSVNSPAFINFGQGDGIEYNNLGEW